MPSPCPLQATRAKLQTRCPTGLYSAEEERRVRRTDLPKAMSLVAAPRRCGSLSHPRAGCPSFPGPREWG